MDSPITIVIPAYNRSHTLPRTLDSIERQTLEPARVVLVDNGSSDQTLALMREWAAADHSFDVVVLTENKPGACAARNRGLQAVETEFVMFFDSDDEMLPTHVADFAEAIRNNPSTDIFGRSIITESIDGRRRRLYFTDRDPMFNHLFRGCLSTQRMVVRTSLVRDAGAWNEEIPVWNDYEFGVRLLLMSDRIKELPGQPTVITYQQAESITGTSFSEKAGKWESTLDRVEALFAKSGRQDLMKFIDCRRMILAARYRSESDGYLHAEKLIDRVMSRSRYKMRMKLVYLHNRIFHRLTWAFVRLLFLSRSS